MDDVMYLIAGAVKAAARAQGDGTSLEEALVKTARDQNLTLEQTKRVVEGLNTLNTLDQFKMDKTAEFPVADQRDIVAQIFQEKQAQYLPQPETPLEYMLGETQQFMPHQDRLLLKQAHAILDATPAPSRYDRDPDQLSMMIGQNIDAMEKEAFEWEVEAQHQKDEVFGSMHWLATSFQKQGSMTLTEFAKEAAQRWGPVSREYIGLLGKVVPQKFHGGPVEKTASAWIDDRTEQHQLFDAVLQSERKYALALQKAADARNTAEGWKEGLRSAFFPKVASLRGPRCQRRIRPLWIFLQR